MRITKRRHRWLALALCLCLLAGIFPLTGMTYAAETGCNHTHDENCGYAEVVEAKPCTFRHTPHDDTCGYAEAAEASPCQIETEHVHDEFCGGDPETGEGCNFKHEHDDTCGYAEPAEASPCQIEAEHVHDEFCGGDPETGEGCNFKHEHDDTCGYAEPAEASPCTVEAAHTVHDESCGYVEEKEAAPCNHQHDASCGGLNSLGQNGLPTLPQNRANTIPEMNPKAVGFAGVEWWVIGKDGTGINSEDGTMTLLSKEILFTTPFDTDDNRGDTANNQYGGSLLQKAMENYYTSLSAENKALIVARTQLDGVLVDGNYGDATLFGTHHVWPLSVDEANSLPRDTIRVNGSLWWLRSAYFDTNGNHGVGAADPDGGLNALYPTSPMGGRPAFTLNLDSVIFTSAAAGGDKSNAAPGHDALTTLSATDPVKLTVKDDRNLSLNVTTPGTITATVGDTASFDYTGAATGTGRSISVLIKNKTTGDILYYGRPVNCQSGNEAGTARFQLPDGLTVGDYTLLAFNEQVNGENETDFASTPVERTLKVEPEPEPITLPGVTLNGKVGFAGTEWFVIGLNKENDKVNPRNGTMTLLSEDALFTTEFDTIANRGEGANSQYDGSLLQKAMENFYKGGNSPLLNQERTLIRPRELDGVRVDDDYNATLPGSHHVWPLSLDEAESLPRDTIRAIGSIWWLRSPHINNDVGTVDVNGYMFNYISNVFVTLGGRPAFTLNLDSVIFTSAAAGGDKSIATPGHDALTTLSATDTVKLTVKDDTNLSLNVTTPGTITATVGDTASFDYTGAATGTGRSVSVLIKDKATDSILYYGRPVNCESGNGSGTARFQLPDSLAEGNYTLLAFNEQVNGKNETDFASTPVERELKVEPKAAPHTHTYGTDWKNDANQHWHECTAGDGARSDEAAHTASDWIVDKLATENEAGSRHKVCTVCGYVMQTESIAPTGPSYTWKTLTDPSGVRVSGSFTDDAALEVKERLLHPAETCDVCDNIRERQDKGELIVLYDIALKSGSYTGDLTVEIPVGETYNDQTIILIHCKNKVMESRTLTVSGGYAKGTFSSLSPFAVAKVPASTVISGLPENYTLLVGQTVSWTPKPAGGSWSYDQDLLSMTKDGDTYTFKALKEGKATATYTVNGVPHTVTITINSSTIPQTGDTTNTLLWVLLMLAALGGIGGLLAYRKFGYKKRHG